MIGRTWSPRTGSEASRADRSTGCRSGPWCRSSRARWIVDACRFTPSLPSGRQPFVDVLGQWRQRVEAHLADAIAAEQDLAQVGGRRASWGCRSFSRQVMRRVAEVVGRWVPSVPQTGEQDDGLVDGDGVRGAWPGSRCCGPARRSPTHQSSNCSSSCARQLRRPGQEGEQVLPVAAAAPAHRGARAPGPSPRAFRASWPLPSVPSSCPAFCTRKGVSPWPAAFSQVRLCQRHRAGRKWNCQSMAAWLDGMIP